MGEPSTICVSTTEAGERRSQELISRHHSRTDVTNQTKSVEEQVELCPKANERPMSQLVMSHVLKGAQLNTVFCGATPFMLARLNMRATGLTNSSL